MSEAVVLNHPKEKAVLSKFKENLKWYMREDENLSEKNLTLLSVKKYNLNYFFNHNILFDIIL